MLWNLCTVVSVFFCVSTHWDTPIHTLNVCLFTLATFTPSIGEWVWHSNQLALACHTWSSLERCTVHCKHPASACSLHEHSAHSYLEATLLGLFPFALYPNIQLEMFPLGLLALVRVVCCEAYGSKLVGSLGLLRRAAFQDYQYIILLHITRKAWPLVQVWVRKCRVEWPVKLHKGNSTQI